jgi:hypothetical protein
VCFERWEASGTVGHLVAKAGSCYEDTGRAEKTEDEGKLLGCEAGNFREHNKRNQKGSL